MRFTSLLLAVATCLVCAVNAAPQSSTRPIFRLSGNTIGQESLIDSLPFYISKPPRGVTQSKTALVYLTDPYGIPDYQNRLLIDSFARAGFLTVAPELFQGAPIQAGISLSNLEQSMMMAAHYPSNTDSKVTAAINYVKQTLGFKKVAVAGDCFGGRYAFRALASGWGADVGFAGHPTLLADEEVLNITKSVTVALAGKLSFIVDLKSQKLVIDISSVTIQENESQLFPVRRAQLEALLQNTTVPYTVSLYSGTSTCFVAKTNVTDAEKTFAKKEAFFQAVRFFNAWA
ncbi:hypothetical protein HDV00_011238 [Rhizophlyctis rosea]|nr:hypothetical protein HDV00_011238 [Rhizophlyctis rosea]